MNEENDIELRTEEVNEILSSTPNFVLRFGILVIFVLFLLGIGISYFISYPDLLIAEIKLTTINPPIKLVSKSSGKLVNLYVKNNQVVKPAQVIALIENTANFQDVFYLDSLSTKILENIKNSDTLVYIPIKTNLKVGDITPNYLEFLKSIKDLFLYKNTNSFTRQITLLQKDLVNYNGLLSKYRNQESIKNQQLALAEMDYNRDKTLFESNTITSRELETKKKEYLNALNEAETSKIMISNALILINGIEKNILQLQIQDYQEQSKLRSELTQNLKSLVNEINKWKQLYLIQSPIEGTISFFSVWNINQNIVLGDELFAIVPNQRQQYVGKCLLPSKNSGKLELGQKVNIKLNNYPFEENGMLFGKVSTISPVPNKDNIALDVLLVNGLTTSFHKTLTYQEEMAGTAEIITKEYSVLDRVFFSFKKLLDR